MNELILLASIVAFAALWRVFASARSTKVRRNPLPESWYEEEV